ncbi:hypothetical protein K438DRAFT_1996728 [Mycena galopus ATCC 62051]|nr:hypothetical protein K438DRAFT_1996728 [Mycena galopus ATCC 62051]
MEDGAPLLETFTSAISESNLPHDAGSFFPRARHFTIAGGTYTSNVTQVAPTVRHGDLNLLHEIHLEDGPGIITRRRSTGKFYHVHLDSRASTMTAVVYQGEEGEQAWRRELQTYSGIRHPNIVQIYGAVSSSGLYATIFHDEFISLDQYCDDLDQYDFQKELFTRIYLAYCAGYELKDAANYLASQGASLASDSFRRCLLVFRTARRRNCRSLLGYDTQPADSQLRSRAKAEKNFQTPSNFRCLLYRATVLVWA